MSTGRFDLVLEVDLAPEADRKIGSYEDPYTCAWVAHSHAAQFGSDIADYYVLEMDQGLGFLKWGWRADDVEIKPTAVIVKPNDILSYKRSIWVVRSVEFNEPLVSIQRFERGGSGKFASLSIADMREVRKIVGVK